jgi:membrane-anchored mycosin MYCP
MGSLEEWIRVNRRAQIDPIPQPSAEPVEIPPLPSADALPEASSPLLPSRDTLLYGTLPLMLGTAVAILVGLGVTAAVRRIRSSSRAPSR